MRLLFCCDVAPVKQLSLGIPNTLFYAGVITLLCLLWIHLSSMPINEWDG